MRRAPEAWSEEELIDLALRMMGPPGEIGLSDQEEEEMVALQRRPLDAFEARIARLRAVAATDRASATQLRALFLRAIASLERTLAWARGVTFEGDTESPTAQLATTIRSQIAKYRSQVSWCEQCGASA